MKKKSDFEGWATKAGIKCSDGRTILPNAFSHNDGEEVPLVWQHNHDDPRFVLGTAKLENRGIGVYCKGYFNNTELANSAKEAVRHGDINSLSIYANHLDQDKNKNVIHGDIKEVSLVLAGANPGARIENVTLAHGDDVNILDDEAYIYTGETLQHSEQNEEDMNQNTNQNTNQTDTEAPDLSDPNMTVEDVINTFTPEQLLVFNYLLKQAAEGDQDQVNQDDQQMEQSGIGDEYMFDAFSGESTQANATLSHDDIKEIFDDIKRDGGSMKNFFEHNDTHKYGIQDINALFPDAKTISSTPEFYARRSEWVNTVLTGTNHVPFSRIKSLVANITKDEARAKGYTLDRNNNKRKDEEVFNALHRTTDPQTIYKKQKLDRDDILDITDFDVVSWLKQEMRVMLDEEIARALFIGDGRSSDSPDRINTDRIRPIVSDDDLYTIKTYSSKENETAADISDRITTSMTGYLGSGSPALFAAPDVIASMLVQRDSLGHRLYHNRQELADELGVSDVIDVPVFDGYKDTEGHLLIGIIANLKDYTIGSDKGGEVSMFDDFDLDFNQQKYLIETRVSGALTKPKSAVAVFINGTKKAQTLSSGSSQSQ